MSSSLSRLPPHGWLSEPELAFHPDRPQDRHVHPLLGLEHFGPYSRSLNWVIDPIRIAAVVPNGYLRRIDAFIAEFEQTHAPRERMDYLPRFPTFSRVFGLRIVRANSAQIELPRELDAELATSPTPHLVLAEAITQALSALEPRRNDFDVAVIVLPERWGPAFEGGPEEDFNLHDYLKAVTAVRGIPTQILRESGGLDYYCRCSVMWRQSIALYCKAGGVPWKLADVDPGTAYIGLGYALKATRGLAARFVTCCSQVFDADGTGLEFIAYETDDARVDRDSPFLNRADTLRLVSRSLALYQRRNAGRLPTRLIVHKSTEFKKEEVNGCFDAWSRSEGLELIQIQQNVGWQGMKIDNRRSSPGSKGVPAAFPVDRGTYLSLGGYDALLWTQGNARQVVTSGNFFKEGKGIPHPLLLRRWAGHGGWEEGCRHLLGLTKMNWNNDSLYDRLPVTLRYAQTLAQTVRRMPQITPRPYQFRFFM
jgi:hypothetical protein